MSSSYSYWRNTPRPLPPHAETAIVTASAATTPPVRITANDIVQISALALLGHVRQIRRVSDRRQLANVPRVSCAGPHRGGRSAEECGGTAPQRGLHLRHDAPQAFE